MNQKNMIESHEHIVFCGDHYNPLGLVRSLGEYGIKSIVIITQDGAGMIKRSKYVKEYIIGKSVEECYSLLLERYADQNPLAFVYTADDTRTSYLDQHFTELHNRFIFFNAGSSGRITEFMNKDSINNLAIKHGLNVLPAIKVKHGKIPEHLEYPIITKSIASTVGGWKNDVFICHNERELRAAYEKIKAPVVLLQKYICKKNELCLDGFACNKGKDVFFAIASDYRYILPDTYSCFLNVFNFNNDRIKEKLEGMFEEVGFEGIFSVEFLVDDNDQLYFCEINFRNSTWSYASTCAGMNLPVLWAKCMIGEIEYNESDFLKRIPDGFTAMNEITDFKTRVLGNEQKVGLFRWISDFRKSNCKFYFAKGDIKPVFALINKIVHR